MSLEKILDKILDEARSEAGQIVGESRQKAEEIKRSARELGGRQAAVLLQQVEKQADLEASRLITQARLKKRIDILGCKKELIDEVLEKAFQKHGKEKSGLKRKIILKDGEREELIDQEKLRQALRPKLEKEIAEVLKI